MLDAAKLFALALGMGVAATTGKAASIADIAAGDDRYSTLVAAVSAAGLVETLHGPGPFTVYAPVERRVRGLAERPGTKPFSAR
ncbi:MAG: fasciclin domain-containing protein [Pseudomonadota bacterium]